MELCDWEEVEAKVAKNRFLKAAREGRLSPVYNEEGELNVKLAKKGGFTKAHVFVLRHIFYSRLKDKTPDQVLQFANSILRRTMRMREIYYSLELIVKDKQARGLYDLD